VGGQRMKQYQKIVVKGSEITVIKVKGEDYISLTDMVKNFGDESIIYNWLRNRNTIEFLGIWEQINNPDFNPLEFDRFKNQAGLNSFTISHKKWIDATNAVRIVSKAGRYSVGTFTPLVSLNSIVVSFIFAFMVGVFFGIYPAWKATMANTIDALRYE
jgi:hypothetical protein